MKGDLVDRLTELNFENGDQCFMTPQELVVHVVAQDMVVIQD